MITVLWLITEAMYLQVILIVNVVTDTDTHLFYFLLDIYLYLICLLKVFNFALTHNQHEIFFYAFLDQKSKHI